MHQEEKIPIYTDLTITANSKANLKSYFTSLKQNLPQGWKIEETIYEDTDTFLVLKDVFKLKTHSFIDIKTNQILASVITIGLTKESILVLKIDFTEKVSEKEVFKLIGYVMHSLHELVLKKNKYYQLFHHSFSFGGAKDENFNKTDLRNERTIKFYSKKEQSLLTFSKGSRLKLKEYSIFYTPPNNISLSLSIMKKSLCNAKRILNDLIKTRKKQGSEIEIEERSKLYDYFEEIQKGIIFSYVSVEAFSNAAIPDDFVYEKINQKGIKESWSKQNIEQWLSTSEKVGDVLPIILKSENIKTKKFWALFKELENLRNEIIHPKTIFGGSKLDSEIFNHMLNPTIFEKIESGLDIISFYYKLNNKHPYFPLGLGFAEFQIHEIDSVGDYFREYNKDD